MSTKTIIIFIVSILFWLLGIGFLTMQYLEIPKNQIKDTETLLEKISDELLKKNGSMKDFNTDLIRPERYFVIWAKALTVKDLWLPVLYDDLYFKNITVNPKNIQNNLIWTTVIYEKKLNGLDFIVWINKYSTDYYIINVAIPFIFLLILYLLMLLIISLLFFRYKETEYVDINNEESIEDTGSSGSDLNDRVNYNITQEEFNCLFPKSDREEPVEEKVDNLYTNQTESIPDEKIDIKEKIIADYKELWSKNFKITKEFKANFPFNKIYDLIKFGVKPDIYIKDVLDISVKYFKWEKPAIYICQDGKYIDSISKLPIDEDVIEIPVKQDKKGNVFIPLFPYNLDKIFGFLNFSWNKNTDFNIADILYFLKFVFSQDAKVIFLNYKEQERVISYLNEKLEKENPYVVCFKPYETDQIKMNYNEMERDSIDRALHNNIVENFRNDYVFKINRFIYGVIGNYTDNQNIIDNVQKILNNKHINELYLEDKVVSVNYSIGISFKNNRKINPSDLINESFKFTSKAFTKGINQIYHE